MKKKPEPNKRGPGRPPGAKNKKPAEGRKVITASVSMPPEKWETLDKMRGELSRGKFIGGLLP